MERRSVLVRAAARGLTGAMMMTGVRQVTTGLGLMEESPPETMVKQAAPAELDRLELGTRKALTELAHWTYGAVGGAVYGMLPAAVRSRPAAGPAYGVLIWLGFEAGLAPLLGLHHPQGRVVGRATMVADHLLYGVVIGGRLAPDPEIIRQQRG